jgi:hypothetical protein
MGLNVLTLVSTFPADLSPCKQKEMILIKL